jgi:DNA polymerase III epsilon subunit-like protein
MPRGCDRTCPTANRSRKIWEFIGSEAVVVGATAAFDSQRLALLFSRYGMPPPPWLYTVVDVCALGAGYLRAKGVFVEFPAQVDKIGEHLGVDADDYARHTAMGDVFFVEDIFDRCVLRPAQQLSSAA